YALPLGGRDDAITRRRPTALQVCGRHGRVHHLERQFRRLPDELLELRRVLKSGHLDEDAVRTLANNVRLLVAERINTPTDDFDRRADGTGGLGLERLVGNGDCDLAVRVAGNLAIRPATAAQAGARKLLRGRPQLA